MATLNEIAFNILNTVSGGQANENKDWSLRQIKFVIKYYRSLLLRRDLRPYEHVQELSQFIPNIPMEIVDRDGSRNTSLPTFYLRTKHKIPSRVRLKNNRNSIVHVGSMDLKEEYDLVPYEQVKWLQYNKYTSHKPRSFIHNDYIYIYSDTVANLINANIEGESGDNDSVQEGITIIEIEGLFDDPEEAHEFAYDRPMDHDKDRFPIAGDHIQAITQSILNGEANAIMNNIYNPSQEAIRRGSYDPMQRAQREQMEE